MTLLKRALVVAMLGTTSAAWAQVDQPNPLPGPAPQPGAVDQYGQMPRRPVPKLAQVVKPAGESFLVMKFVDSARMRPKANQGARFAPSVDTTAFDAIANQYNLKFKSAFGPNISEADMAALERRAAIRSNKAQPDLAGMVIVHGNPDVLVSAANALNQLDVVEWIMFQKEFRPFDVPESPAPAPAPMPTFDPPASGGGIAGGTCDDCGTDFCESCFTVHPGPWCTVLGENPAGTCCDLVGDVRPFCDQEIGGQWDSICVAIANLFCACPDTDADGVGDCFPLPAPGPNRCASLLNGSCYTPHSTGGCVNPLCCATVCALDAFCCDSSWDASCVSLADANCVSGTPAGPTPDLTALQGYLRRTSYSAQPGGIPPGLSLPAPTLIPAFAGLPEYRGQGMWLFDDSVLTDHPGMPAPKRYNGLYGLGRQLNDPVADGGYGVGPYNGARGRSIKVAVIEWSYYQGHEDLDVISEPGQTLITIPDVGFPSHATACLGIINAQINGKGMNGIAPDAKAYFFPLTSIEEGPREFAAFFHMMETLDAGDVCSNSWGGGGNLNTNQDTWTLIRMASDLGITVCIAAGNDCANLDNAGDFGDSGGIVVGACTPGTAFSRLTFSNYYQGGTTANSNIVHFSGWGECVPAPGGSANVFFPNSNWNRSYCSNFNGTSAACPAAAGVVACLQGLAKQFYGLPLQPEQIRAAITSTGSPQQGGTVGGFPDTVPCGPDTNFDEGPNLIGPYPRPERAGYFILNQSSVGFTGAPWLDDVTVIRGNKRFGNKYSIKGSDNNYLVVDTMTTPRKHRPNLPSPANRVNYLGSGEIADIMATGHVDFVGNTMQIDYEYSPPGGVSFLVTELYNVNTKKWVTLSFETTPAPTGADVTGQQLATAAQRFIDQANGNKIYLRQYVLGTGGPVVPGTPPTLTMRWDLLNLQVFTQAQAP